MKRHSFNSLSHFYSDIQNVVGAYDFNTYANRNWPGFTGLSHSEIMNSKFSYQTGVEKLKQLPDFKVEKPEWTKFFNSFDGYDINIERMHDGLDFLIDKKKNRKLPKTMDVYVNLNESAGVGYEEMLNKTYTALKIIDHLEMLGVRTALFSCIASQPKIHDRFVSSQNYMIDICVKDYADPVNLGALCTAISPWMVRHWRILWAKGHIKNLSDGIGYPIRLPSELKGIVIDTGQCLSLYSSQQFISNIRIENAA